MQWHKSSDISQIVISLVLRTRAITCDMPLLAIALPYNIRRDDILNHGDVKLNLGQNILDELSKIHGALSTLTTPDVCAKIMAGGYYNCKMTPCLRV